MEQSLLNRQIGEFIVQKHVGYSALGGIYHAFQPSLNRMIELKVLALENLPLERSEFLREFMQQSSIVTQLEHLHILPVYAYGVVEDELAYIATRITQRKLYHLLHERPISLDRVVFIMEQICSAVEYASKQGVIHGSISPGNIYLDELNNAYIDDYEMTRIAISARNNDELITILGTPTYASIEQLRLENIDHRSDMYSLGALLYRMVAQRPPFEMSNGGIPELIQMHERGELIPPRRFNPDLPPAVEEVVLHAMQEAPDDRFQTAMVLFRELEAAANISPQRRKEHVTPDSIPLPKMSSASQNVVIPIWGMALAGIVIVILVMLVFMLQR